MEYWILRNGTKVRPLSWVEVQHAERDICLMYYQLAKYSYVMGDLSYGEVYDLPYWDYVEVGNIEPDEAAFLRDGCLVMMLAMSWDVMDGSGSYLTGDRLRLCLEAVQRLEGLESSYSDSSTPRLVATVKSAMELVLAERVPADAEARLAGESAWVHGEYVRGYFRSRVHDFENNPYYRG